MTRQMRTYSFIRHTATRIMAAALLTACSTEAGLQPDSPETDTGNQLQFVVKMGGASGSRSDNDTRDNKDYSHINSEFIVNKSRILIQNSTMNSRTPSFDGSGENRRQLYEYICVDDRIYPRPDETGTLYNKFQPLTTATGSYSGAGLLWRGTGSNVIQENGRALYEFTAVYIPVDETYDATTPYPHYRLQQSDNGIWDSASGDFWVSSDQRKFDTMSNQDIMVAYQRMRLSDFGKPIYLTFWHMMAMVTIDVCVPLADDDGTGLPDDAITDAMLTNLYTRYQIVFAGEHNPDSKLPCEATTNKDERVAEIGMCPLGSWKDTKLDENLQERPVQWFRYVALIPSQHDFEDLPFCRFKVRTSDPSLPEEQSTYKTYSFTPSFDITNHTQISLISGMITRLKLEIRREESDPILLTAEILPWTYYKSQDFTLDEETSDDNNSTDQGE